MKKLWSVLKVIGGLLWFAGMAIWTLLSWRRTEDAKTAGEAARKEKADELSGKTPGEIVDSLDNADAVRDVLRRGTGGGDPAGAGALPDAGAPGAPAKVRGLRWRKGSIFH